MEYLCWPNDPTIPIAVDASVVINLNATERPSTIFRSIPYPIVVVEQVALELEAGKRHGRNDHDGLDALVARSDIDRVRLGSCGLRDFFGLVSGPAVQTLDDGEAATIAYALAHNAIALIDERKATKLCAERFKSLLTGCTVDVLLHPEVEKALGRNGLTEAVFNALYFGRMRVPDNHVDWVVNMIGPELAEKCVSLPKSVRCCWGPRKFVT